MSHQSDFLSKFARLLTRHEPLILLLCFQLLLRIPNLFEPYWYGDEAIYLTIGNGLRQGLRLYAETVDHKTPLIYFFAMVPSQFWFRMLLIGWTTLSTIAFSLVARNLRFTPLQRFTATLLFVLLTTLPWLEGNIPNGELFVIGFSLFGLLITSTTQAWRQMLDAKTCQYSRADAMRFFVAGLFFSAAMLTKVPGLFDVAAAFAVGWLLILPHVKKSSFKPQLTSVARIMTYVTAGILVPIALSIVYFWLRGSLSDYLEFGLLYNFRYAGSWDLGITHPLLTWALTLHGKTVILSIAVGIVSLFWKRLTPKITVLLIWFWASMFAALLSSRPYPHYLLHIVAPASLLISSTIVTRKIHLAPRIAAYTSIGALLIAVASIGFGYYPVRSYYQNFGAYITKSIDRQTYYARFDQLTVDNYQVAPLIAASKQSRFFIWGTNPALYAMTGKAQVGRFTASFHIHEFPGAYEETLEAIESYRPDHIIVMKNETRPFPQLFTILSLEYFPTHEYPSMSVYRRASIDLL